MGTLRYIGIFFELLAVIVGSIYFYKYKKTTLKYFLTLLWYVFLNDILGILIMLFITKYNAFIYNIFYVVNFSFFFFLYYNYLNNKRNRKIVIVFSVIYLISFVVNSFYENYLIEYQRFPYILAAIFLVITIILYFIEVLNSEKVLNAKKNLLFWISVGLLLYFVGNIPLRILRNYYIELADATVIFLTNFILTVILNTCYIIGFIWSTKKE